MDKPLSQERLKGVPNTPIDYALSNLWGAIEIADRADDDYAKVEVGTLQFISGELKRLQAIEVDHNRYKRALRKVICLNVPMPDEVFNLVNDALEGVEPNESN